MVNFKDFSKDLKKQNRELERTFTHRKDSKISIVRIAVSFDEALNTTKNFTEHEKLV